VATIRHRREYWAEDPRKQRLMEWLPTPKNLRDPPSQRLLADEIGVSARLLRDWMADPGFRASWEDKAQEIMGSPERTQAVLDTLFSAATDPDNRSHVQAAKLYLEATNSIRPATVEVNVNKKPTELSDRELDELIAQGALAARSIRPESPQPEAVADQREAG
jgi:hypothetical protein